MQCKQFINYIIMVGAEGLGHLGSLFYHDTQNSRCLQIYPGVIFYKMRHHAQVHLAHLYTVPFLWPRNEHKQKCRLVDDFAGQCWLWQLSSCTTLLQPHLVFLPIWRWDDLVFFHLPQSTSSPEGA